jgi:ERCC4-type nuclease
MKIIIDSREQLPYTFSRYLGADDTAETGALRTGDYSIAGYEERVAVERKTLDDFVGSVCQGRSRFENEMLRASEFEYFAIVIEGSVLDVRNGRYKSDMKPHSVLQTAFSWSIRHGVHVIWAGNRPGGEYSTYWILRKYLRAIKMKEGKE